MGAPLNDITIYYSGTKIKDAPDDWEFRLLANYIADFYHNKLNGYKPPKTSRICIHLFAEKVWNAPGYSGSLCHYDNVIDEHKYNGLSKSEKYKYILDLLHQTILQIAEVFNWDKDVFNNAYSEIINNDFTFYKVYPHKTSKDRKKTGEVVIAKSEDKSSLSVRISVDGVTREILLFEKKNWGVYDTSYFWAKECKWIDNFSFGILKGDKKCFYSISENTVTSNLVFGAQDF